MGCLKLTYSQENTSSFWGVWKNPDTQKSCVSWYDYGARFYDPALGRWHSTDPMAEKYFAQSPYHFSGNNPVLFRDIDGMQYGTDPFFQIGAHRLQGGFGSGNSVLLNAMDRLKQQTQEEWQDQQDHFDMINQGIAVAKSYSPEKHEASVSVTGTISGKYEDGGGFDWDIASPSVEGETSSDNNLNPAVSGSLAVGGGIVGSLEQGYKYGNNSVKYAQRINGIKTSSTAISNASKLNAVKMAKGLSSIGRGITGLSFVVAGYQLYNSPKLGSDYARFAGSLLITGTAAVPIFGPFISIGLGAADSYGAFDDFYNSFD